MSSDPRVGTEVAGYRIERLLGRGGMGLVYLATHIRLGRKVALKLLASELADDPKFRERFVRESKLAASLDHPNIIPIYDADEVDGVLFIAMRYVEGTDLKALLESEGHLDPERALGIVGQVAGALDAAHARGLIHRDVKPGNMLITPRTDLGEEEHVYLSDFGLTKRAASDSGITATGQFVGSLDYAAPEQFEGKPLDGRADQYSLGCVLYQCLTGEVPFRRENEAALVYAHLLAPPPPVSTVRPELPAAIDPVVARAMAKKPEDRFGSCGELAGTARRALGVGSGERAVPPLPPPRSRRRLVALAGGGAVVVLAVVVLAVVALSKKNTAAPPTAPGAATAPAHTVMKIDPASGKVVATIRIGNPISRFETGAAVIALPPRGSAVGEGSVWITNGGDDSVSRIDPASRTVTTIHVPGTPDAVAVGQGAVWVVDSLNKASRIDPSTNRIAGTVDFGYSPVGAAIDPSDSAVWVVTQGCFTCPPNGQPPSVIRIDPSTEEVASTLKIVPDLPGWAVAVGRGSVWVSVGSVVLQVDPATGKAIRRIQVGGQLGGIAVDEQSGSVWVTSASSGVLVGALVKIDAASGRVALTLPVSCCPGAIAAGGGSVWVTDTSTDRVSQVSTITDSVAATIQLPGTPTSIAVGEGGVWVSVDVGYTQ